MSPQFLPIKLIVGLRNPGAKYANTRHNAGSWLVEQLAQTCHASFRLEKKFHAQLAKGQIQGEEVILLLPEVYMNQSGLSVQAVSQYYKIPPAAIAVVHDELDIPAGAIKLKPSGGHGGHNGLRNIIDHLHSKDFFRIRVGVGKPKSKTHGVDYVLSPPNQSDKQAIQQAIETCLSTIPLLVHGEQEKAMLQLHSA
jgi:PTH1 family peptidyl-tRNA hydrolase